MRHLLKVIGATIICSIRLLRHSTPSDDLPDHSSIMLASNQFSKKRTILHLLVLITHFVETEVLHWTLLLLILLSLALQLLLLQFALDVAEHSRTRLQLG